MPWVDLMGSEPRCLCQSNAYFVLYLHLPFWPMQLYIWKACWSEKMSSLMPDHSLDKEATGPDVRQPLHPHLGGVPGRYANRIKNSTFNIDGTDYHITPNENGGKNTLHGGLDGWDWRNFTVVSHTTSSITFSIVDPDGKEGFPGEVISYVTYTMSPNTWNIKIVALATTKKTPIMLTSHVRDNLCDAGRS